MTYVGSSPLARGTLIRNPQNQIAIAVHPRLRGELLNVMAGVPSLVGSSPLARGTQETGRAGSANLRFIPACAGNSQIGTTSTGFPTVHPRLRGELAGLTGSDYEAVGSSPLARGTPESEESPFVIWRFIPACAGNSDISFRFSWMKFGSSPLARGTRLITERHFQNQRFIPACAGNSLKMVTTLH